MHIDEYLDVHTLVVMSRVSMISCGDVSGCERTPLTYEASATSHCSVALDVLYRCRSSSSAG